jgi:uncharacterized protein YndB with AHSA1/START domain
MMEASAPTHAPVRKSEHGCLAIADISGYTTYLAAAELDHAQDVLEDLTETVVRSLSPPLRLAKLEGDAVFVYLPGERHDASMLLDTVDATYFAFRRRLDAIDRATQCTCNACVLIPRLDLKFIVHHGRFGRQRIAGQEELSGPDVILVHRLLKNRVAGAIGHAGYVLYTEPVIGAMGLEPAALRFSRHDEELDDVGRIAGWVGDLHERWTEERERRRVKVSPDAAMLTIDPLPAERQVVWHYLTDPELRPAWQPGMTRIDETSPAGRRGAGTTNHCVHGKDTFLEEIQDWRPFDYLTVDLRPPMPVIGPVRITTELEDVPGGTQVTERVAPLGGLAARLAFPVFRRMYLKVARESYQRLRDELIKAGAPPTPEKGGGAEGEESEDAFV